MLIGVVFLDRAGFLIGRITALRNARMRIQRRALKLLDTYCGSELLNMNIHSRKCVCLLPPMPPRAICPKYRGGKGGQPCKRCGHEFGCHKILNVATKVALAACLFLCGCTVVSANRVFPKLAWAWSKDAKAERQARRNAKAYDEFLRTNKVSGQVFNGVDLARIQKRDGTNFIGVYLGMIAEHDGKGSVQMFSATSGQLLKWISYEDFKAIFVDKTKSEYPKP